MDSEGGGFNLAAMQKDLYINVVPFLNGGNVHRFIARILSRELDHKPDFAYISHLLTTFPEAMVSFSCPI